MADAFPAATCGCTASDAISCCVPGCALSACLDHAADGWEEAFVGEGPLGIGGGHGLFVPAPVSLHGYEAFIRCGGTLFSGGIGCGVWICEEHFEAGGRWEYCERCSNYFCPGCDSTVEFDCGCPTLCRQCAPGTFYICPQCDKVKCLKEGGWPSCDACERTFCDECLSGWKSCASCGPEKKIFCKECASAHTSSCEQCGDSLCISCIEIQGPNVECWECSKSMCASCDADQSEPMIACAGRACGRLFCSRSTCQAQLMTCADCLDQCCARCTCSCKHAAKPHGMKRARSASG